MFGSGAAPFDPAVWARLLVRRDMTGGRGAGAPHDPAGGAGDAQSACGRGSVDDDLHRIQGRNMDALEEAQKIAAAAYLDIFEAQVTLAEGMFERALCEMERLSAAGDKGASAAIVEAAYREAVSQAQTLSDAARAANEAAAERFAAATETPPAEAATRKGTAA
ncbi:MAG: hypothetical protein AAF360_04410 [Pseudomonadota bacterium]